MRVLVIGGTIFIGRRAVRMLKDAGHDVAVLHRGTHEPDDFTDVTHIHGDRNELGPLKGEIENFAPDVVWDNMAMFQKDAEHVVQTLGDGVRYVVTSSMDVYKMYGALHKGTSTEPIPADEDAPTRPERYPYRGQFPGMDDYDKLDVEDVYLAAGATVLRYPMVYGPNDGQRREWYVLSRVHAGRKKIPVGSGTWLATKGFVEDIANGTKLAIENEGVRGEVFNFGEALVYPTGLWSQMILDAAGSDAELVRVPDDKLPEDLDLTGIFLQHLVCDCSKARRLLGYTDTDALDALKTTVEWHLAHPPQKLNDDWSADDAALEAAIA